ncbi:hypothetical protein D3C78_1921620 [compost metagenome]
MLETPPADGGAMLTTGTPLVMPTDGFAPDTLLSTEIGKVWANSGVHTCVNTMDQTISERSLDIRRT